MHGIRDSKCGGRPDQQAGLSLPQADTPSLVSVAGSRQQVRSVREMVVQSVPRVKYRVARYALLEMPAYQWPSDSVSQIQAFEARHGDAEAGALLLSAVLSVDALHYLGDVDALDDLSQETINGHAPHVVDVAHARWATGTCCTALDLCAASLGRVFCPTKGPKERALASFVNDQALLARLPVSARGWVQQVDADPAYRQIKEARNALTHARLPRRFSMPRQRLQLQVGATRFDVARVVTTSTLVATGHVCRLLKELPML